MPMYEASVRVQLTIKVEAEEEGQATDLIHEFLDTELVEAGKMAGTPVDVIINKADVDDIMEL